MDYYFVVLQLPGGKELKFTDDEKKQEYFWDKAAQMIEQEQAGIVCVRQDTGVSDDVRKHYAEHKSFNTYLLFHLMLKNSETNKKKAILNKAADILKTANYETLIDSGDNFQLLAADYLDANSFMVN